MTEKKFPKFEEKDYSDLEQDPYVQKYLNGVKSTKQRLSLIQEFCEFNDMSPKELIIEHSKDSKQEDPLNQTNIAKKRLHSFFGYLTHNEDERYSNTINNKVREKRVSWNSARQYPYSKLTSFYKKNNVPVSFDKKEIPHAKQGTKSKTWKDNGDRVKDYSKTLKRIRDSLPNIRDKAILLCKVSSGMDDVDLFKLKINQFDEGYYKEDNVCYLEGYRQKTDEYYQTFFNSEACDMIKVYLKDRERKIYNTLMNEEEKDNLTEDEEKELKEKLKLKSKLKAEDWLFVGNKKVNDEYTQLKPRLFAAEMRQVCEMLNIKGVTPKALRRQFRTNLANKVKDIIVKRMMGQTVEISADYFLDFSNPDAFEEYYVQEIEEHTLLGNGNGRITKVKEELESLKQTINILSEENKELKDAMKEVRENLPKLIEKYMKEREDEEERKADFSAQVQDSQNK